MNFGHFGPPSLLTFHNVNERGDGRRGTARGNCLGGGRQSGRRVKHLGFVGLSMFLWSTSPAGDVDQEEVQILRRGGCVCVWCVCVCFFLLVFLSLCVVFGTCVLLFGLTCSRFHITFLSQKQIGAVSGRHPLFCCGVQNERSDKESQKSDVGPRTAQSGPERPWRFLIDKAT